MIFFRNRNADAPAVIRVMISQPALPSYRLAVFRALAKCPGLSLTVEYGRVPELKNVDPDGFQAHYQKFPEIRIGSERFVFHFSWLFEPFRRRYDVLIYNWDTHFIFLIPTLILAKLFGKRTILWGHGYSKRHSAGIFSFFRQIPAWFSKAIIFYDEFTAQNYIDSGWDKKRIYVARNTIESKNIIKFSFLNEKEPARLDKFRESNGLMGCKVLLFVSRLEPENEVDLLLRAASKLLEKRNLPEFKVVIVGAGRSSEDLKRMAVKIGLKDRAIFVGALYDEEVLSLWFGCADAFCYPRNVGLSLIHSFFYGVPVVTAADRTKQNPEFSALKDEENGLLYKDGDVDDFAAQLSRIIAEPDFRCRLAQGAKKTSEKYSLEVMVDGLEAAIKGNCPARS